MKQEIKCIEISIAYDDGLPQHYGYYDTVQEAMEALKALDKEHSSQRTIKWRAIYK